MSYTQISQCPQCGAPIYAPSSWMSILPPPNTYSCDCKPQRTRIITTTTTTPNLKAPCIASDYENQYPCIYSDYEI